VASSGKPMRGITEKRDAAIRNVLRLALPRHMPKFLVEGVRIDEAILFQCPTRAWACKIRRTEASSRLARDVRPDFMAFCNPQRGVGHRRHYQGVCPGCKRAHRRFSRAAYRT